MLDQIRGRTYEEALILLEYLPFRACEPVLDTLISVGLPFGPPSSCLLDSRRIGRAHGVVGWINSCSWCFTATMQAAANAKNNLGMRKAKLYVSECMADGGPVLKRIRPRAKGRCGGAPCLLSWHHQLQWSFTTSPKSGAPRS